MADGSEITPGEVHLWWGPLAIGGEVLARCRALLDPAEIARAERLRIPEARRRFIAARATLRTILGEVTATEPRAVRFAYGEHGKPRLAGGGPCFNASGSGDHVVVALAGAELGVDLELLRPLARPEALAQRICTAAELAAWEKLPEADLDAALLRLWTAKEAALKALGTGLGGGLRNVELELDGSRPPRLRRLCGAAEGWQLLVADPAPGLLCTVVVRGGGRRLVQRPLPPSATMPG
jgi:4'-phosphopantetheinyl transferase